MVDPYVLAVHADRYYRFPLIVTRPQRDVSFEGYQPHKFAGGPQASGVLVYKKALATRGVSSSPGGPCHPPSRHTPRRPPPTPAVGPLDVGGVAGAGIQVDKRVRGG